MAALSPLVPSDAPALGQEHRVAVQTLDEPSPSKVHRAVARTARSQPPEASVFFGAVRGFVQEALRAGASREALQRVTHVDLDHLDRDARLPRSELIGLIDAALEGSGDPALGLHCIQRISPVSYGPLAHMVAHSRTLAAALDGLTQFHRLLSDEPPFVMLLQDSKVVLQKSLHSDDPPQVQRATTEMSVLGLFRLVRTFGGAPPEVASFSYAPPPYEAEYAHLFEGRARFGQPFTGVVFDRAWLNTPSQHSDEELHASLQQLAEQRLMRADRRVPYAVRVRDVLRKHGSSENPLGMPDAADLLGMSVRSLRRHLTREGTSYTAIVNESLGTRAKELLVRHSIQEAAYTMGFAEPSSFHRAFKRWTGITPGAFKER